jgi:hypothetical protein
MIVFLSDVIALRLYIGAESGGIAGHIDDGAGKAGIFGSKRH